MLGRVRDPDTYDGGGEELSAERGAWVTSQHSAPHPVTGTSLQPLYRLPSTVQRRCNRLTT